jgi:hypothetical protein
MMIWQGPARTFPSRDVCSCRIRPDVAFPIADVHAACGYPVGAAPPGRPARSPSAVVCSWRGYPDDPAPRRGHQCLWWIMGAGSWGPPVGLPRPFVRAMTTGGRLSRQSMLMDWQGIIRRSVGKTNGIGWRTGRAGREARPLPNISVNITIFGRESPSGMLPYPGIIRQKSSPSRSYGERCSSPGLVQNLP